MRVRTLLTMTAIVSSALGAGAAYLALTVPNDLKADSMLKQARKDLETGKREPARDQLSAIVQQYPRTDAAAAATVALVTLGEQQRKELEKEIAALRSDAAQHGQALTDLQKTVGEIKSAPPKQIIVQAPAPKRSAKKAVKKKTTTRRRRGR
jgi:hypothetical protein